MFKIIPIFIVTAMLVVYILALSSKDTALGAFSDPFVSVQLADSPVNGKCLLTDGSNNTWSDCASGSFSTTTNTYWAENSLQLGQISDVSTSSLATGYVLKWSGTAWESVATSSLNIAGSGSGTVTSVDMSVPTGLTISGNPVTTSGTLAVAYTSGYSIPKTASTTEGTTAYLWGNHASAGYAPLVSPSFTTPTLGNASATALTVLAKSFLLGNVAIGTTTDPLASLHIDSGVTTDIDALFAEGTINNYYQLNIKNRSAGTGASTDVVATQDTGNELSGFINMGINSSGYTAGIVGNANDSYIYGSSTGNMLVGSPSKNKDLLFFTNGTNAYTNERMRILSTGLVGIGTTSPYTALGVNGTVVASNFVATSTTASTSLTNVAISGVIYRGTVPLLASGGTLTSAYHCRWDGTGVDCDRVEDASGVCGANAVCMGGHTHVGVNEAFATGWNADVDPPEKDDVYDWGHVFDWDNDGLVNRLDTGYGYIYTTLAGTTTATSSPTVDYVTATSTTASSSLQWVTATAFGIVGKFFASATQFVVNLPAMFMESLQIPTGTAPTVDANGEIAHDTTGDQLIVGANADIVPLSDVKIWGTTIASTSLAFINAGLLPVPTVLDGYTITRIQCHVVGGTSKVIAVEDASANSSEDITCGTTNTTDDGSLTNATFTASELPFIDFGATSGAVDYVVVSVFGNWTRE